jgi:tRNA A-37 threonylcarbamoyl transferase component Bud32/membrane-associated phospholipid phosphatase
MTVVETDVVPEVDVDEIEERPGRSRLGRGTKKRRRPSGEPPPLPRPLRTSGRYWLALTGIVVLTWIVLFVVNQAGGAITRVDISILKGISKLRTDVLTSFMKAVHWLGSDWAIRILRWGTILILLAYKRFRHLFVYLFAILAAGLLTTTAAHGVGRPRPFDVDIIGHWQGASHPSRPIVALAVTLVGIAYTVVVPGRPRTWAKWAIGVCVIALGVARLYLGVDHPTDVLFASIIGITIPLIAFRLFTPNEIFPVRYKRGKAAHLDVEGERGDAIRRAVEEQLGVTLTDVQPFNLEGSGGSTPLKLTVAGEPCMELFGKLYASTHLRADRWYKLGRTLLYGRLEDEASFSTVRRLIQYEDYLLRVMRDAGLATPTPYGFVEITPEREYMLVTDFVPQAKEILDVEVTNDIIDQCLGLVRKLWDAGIAHRDIKPSNILVAKGKVHLIDVAFGEIRPSPWREAVDLANMMIVLALDTDAESVYQRALKVFTPEEIAEAFAATHSVTMPSQSRNLMKEKARRDLLDDFRQLAPKRRPVSIQQWSWRRIGLTSGVLFLGLIAVLLSLSNLPGAGLLPPERGSNAAFSTVADPPDCGTPVTMILESQSVPSASLIPCVEALQLGWTFRSAAIEDGSTRFYLDSDRAGFRAVEVSLQPSCDTSQATEVPSDEPGTLQFEKIDVFETDRYAGLRYYTFEGGCTIYRFDFTGEGRTGLAGEVSNAVGFFSRNDLTPVVEELSGHTL